MDAKEHAIKIGTCGFCGHGGGHLGDQGDESTQTLHATVVTVDESGERSYSTHPNAYGHLDEDGNETLKQRITWCGHCVNGLAHKYQRYDDTNLHGIAVSYKVRLELDGIRWTHWEERGEGFKKAHPADDPAIHLEKLRIESDLRDIQNEQYRRAGFDLTSRGWRA